MIESVTIFFLFSDWFGDKKFSYSNWSL